MGETTGKVRVARAAAAGASGDTPGQIRSEIEETRAEMSETISALEEKLDPAHIVEQVKEEARARAVEAIDSAKARVKETAGKAETFAAGAGETVSDLTRRAGAAMKDNGSFAMQYIKQNPAPFVLAGLNLGALAWEAYRGGEHKNRGQERFYGRPASDSGQASSRMRTAERGNPITFGMAALAAASVVGFAIPAARFGRDNLSGAGDRLLTQAKSMARQFRYAAERAGRKLQRTAQERGLAADPAESLFSESRAEGPLPERIT